MSTQRIAVVLLALLALAGIAATCAQERSRAPWPSEVFNAKPRANTAGKFDYYTMVMSWSPTHCATAEDGRDEQQCARQDGLRYGFVLHGLWPQYEKGYPEACPTGRKPFVPRPVIDSMLDIMPSSGLVIHEYKLHGTCSGLEPDDYYKLSRALFTRVRIPERYRNPFETQFVAPRELVGEFMRANPGLRPEMIAVELRRTGQPPARRPHLHDPRWHAARLRGEREPAQAVPGRANARAAGALDAARQG